MRKIDGITIGIIARNEERSIGKTLASLVRAIYYLFERRRLRICISIVINATTDNTKAVVNRFISRIKNDLISFTVYNTPVPGKPNAINYIRKHSTTDHIIFMDADILVKEDCLFRLIQGYENSECKIASTIGMPRKMFYLNPIKAKLAIKMIEYATREGSAVDGAMYLVNKNIFGDMPEWIINDDLYIAISVKAENIKRVKNAVTFQEPVGSFREYYHRMRRIKYGDEQLKQIFGTEAYYEFRKNTRDRRSKQERKAHLPVPLRVYEKILFPIDIILKVFNQIVKREINKSKKVLSNGWQTQSSSKL